MARFQSMAVGVLSGLVVLMGGMLHTRAENETAHAAAPQAVDNNGKYAVAVGGSAQGLNDMLWVLTEHKPHPNMKRDTESKVLKNEMISLCLYKIAENGKKMQFVSARDLAYDIEVTNMGQERPSVFDIVKELKDNLK